jgi:redox-sensitive bicupin YhaK (pirin superfamily)
MQNSTSTRSQTLKMAIRKSAERGPADHGWLKSMHSFSFAGYYDPKHMGFRALRVINEDRIEGGSGFGSHPHRDMEIISYVVKGALKHEDSMGTKAIISPGEIQRMSAGTGVVHSEANASKEGETHFFQIWVLPKHPGGAPGSGQKSFAEDLKKKNLVLVLSPEARDGSIGIQQDVDMYISRLKTDETLNFSLRARRGLWVQVVDGSVSVNGTLLAKGDAVAVESAADEAATVTFTASAASEFLLLDLA